MKIFILLGFATDVCGFANLASGKDSLSTTRHSGRTLTVGQGNYLSRYLRYALKQKARLFVVS